MTRARRGGPPGRPGARRLTATPAWHAAVRRGSEAVGLSALAVGSALCLIEALTADRAEPGVT